jgi:MFS family permease
VLLGGILLGLVLGLLAGGSLANLGTVRLRWVAFLFAAVLVRFTTETALGANLAIAEALQLPLFALAYGMLLAGLWVNRGHPGMSLAFVGVLANATAIIVNGGFMPIWEPSLLAAGFTETDVRTGFHVILSSNADTADFLVHVGFLGDVIPVPIQPIQNVASIGDLFLTAGLAFFLFATVVRNPQELDEEAEAAIRRRIATIATTPVGRPTRAQTGLGAGFAESAALERTIVLGGSGAGLSGPTATPLPFDAVADVAADMADITAADLTATGRMPTAPTSATAPGSIARPVAIPIPRPDVFDRARRHPYVRLALNPSFSGLWAGQLISLFGDRIHQVALAFLVLYTTGSELAVALVFLAATLPNLLISPIAGTFVDRWEHQEVLVVSDLLRAATVVLIPIAAVTNIALVYPLIFLLTTISIFFRPARVAILPRIVRDDELLPANSAMWVSETMADVIGYPLAGLFVAFLGASLPLAFWFDAATYIASAVLLWTIIVPPMVRRIAPSGQGSEAKTGGTRGFFREMGQGWAFLRHEPTLLANTIQATVAQFTVGILTALTAVYAANVIMTGALDPEAIYAFLETGIGVGNLVGGFILGLIGARLARGRLVIIGYTAWGLCVAGLAITDNLAVAIGLMLGSGVANMIYIIPSQTLFQERTPAELMGRVVGFRYALVGGSMAIAMVVGGVLGSIVGVAPILGVFGLITAATGLAGLLVPAVRDA